MVQKKLDKETLFLLGLIVFGLAVTLFIEFSGINHRPVILLIFIGISTTALIYKLLGGIKESFFGTPLFKISGSGAFLFAFIYFINPILERQTFPQKNELFHPPVNSWIPVDKENMQPVGIELNYLNYKYLPEEFGNFSGNNTLYFKTVDNDVSIYNDSVYTFKLGRIPLSNIENKLPATNTISQLNSEVFLSNINLYESTPFRSWFLYQISPIQFDNNTTTYKISNKNGKTLINSEIQLRGSKIHHLGDHTFLITIHRVNHETKPHWVRFAVTELNVE